jgi:protein ImuA
MKTPSSQERESEHTHSEQSIDTANITAQLLKHPAIFRFGDVQQVGERVLSTGFESLDQALGGGWPMGGLIEMLCDRVGIGEASLLLPVLPKAEDSLLLDNEAVMMIREQAVATRFPSIMYAPALDFHGVDLERVYFVDTNSMIKTLWVLEQALLSRAMSHVFAWIQQTPNNVSMRRIAYAARRTRSLSFLMRPIAAARTASPAELRLVIEAGEYGATKITVIKNRGLAREQTVEIQTRDMPCLAPDRKPVALVDLREYRKKLKPTPQTPIKLRQKDESRR